MMVKNSADINPAVNKHETKRKWKIPHTYALLFFVIVFVAALTYVLPAGEFDRVENSATGRIVIEAESFHSVDSNPASIFDIFKSIPIGMENAGYIIFFVFIIGGSFGIIQATGTIETGIGAIVRKVEGKEKLVIPLFMFIFSIAGATMGMAEELLPFYPIAVALAIALKFDSIVGTSLVLLGAGAGFAGAFMNPFTVGIAQGIGELPLYSGMQFRLVMYAVMLTTGVVYVYRYAKKIQKDPKLSYMYEIDSTKDVSLDIQKLGDFTTRHKLVLLIFAAGLILIAIGVSKFGWYITELAAVFLMMGILSGIVGGLGIDKTASEFVKGTAGMAFGALVIGIASGIIVVLQEGRVLDTIVYSLAQLITVLPSSLAAIGMFFVQAVINVFIPSGSGQAAASMPIMIPVADLVGITRQTAVVAFQFGDGILNVFQPTSAYFMAGLALAGIPWDKWVKFCWPLMLIWFGIASIFLFIATMINLGPF